MMKNISKHMHYQILGSSVLCGITKGCELAN